MDAVSAAASILAIAGAGIQVSLKLIAFADQVGTAPERIQDVGTDVSVTAGTLRELGELMKKKTSSNKSTGIFKPDQVENVMITSIKCEHIFDELKKILERASQQLRNLYNSTSKNNDPSSRIKLSSLERMKWPFLQPSIQPLRSALGDAKATLTLLLQVVHLRYAHVTASLDKEEQNDLIRMIAAMRRQQLASMYGGGGGDKGLEVSDSDAENSDSSGRAEVETVLEAWSVTPNTLPDSVPQHLLVTPIPVSQQQIEKILRTSPQDLREVSSIIDSLSSMERDFILGNVLRHNHSNPGDSTIRSISRENWTGSHVLFGKVTSRKFRLIIERRVEKPTSSRAHKNHVAGKVFSHRRKVVMPEEYRLKSDYESRSYAGYSDTSYSDADETHATEAYTHDPRVSPSPKTPFGTTAEQTRYQARKRTKTGCLSKCFLIMDLISIQITNTSQRAASDASSAARSAQPVRTVSTLSANARVMYLESSSWTLMVLPSQHSKGMLLAPNVQLERPCKSPPRRAKKNPPREEQNRPAELRRVLTMAGRKMMIQRTVVERGTALSERGTPRAGHGRSYSLPRRYQTTS